MAKLAPEWGGTPADTLVTPAAEAQAQLQASPSGNGCREDSTAIYFCGYAPKRASWKH